MKDFTDAVRLAIEKGGFRFDEPPNSRTKQYALHQLRHLDDWNEDYQTFTSAEVVINPAFWQALGKALGWEKNKWYPFNATHPHLGLEMDEWKWWMHLYLDAVIEGTEAKFWSELIKET